MYQVSYKSNSIDNSALAKASSLFCDHFPLSFSLLQSPFFICTSKGAVSFLLWSNVIGNCKAIRRC